MADWIGLLKVINSQPLERLYISWQIRIDNIIPCDLGLTCQLKIDYTIIVLLVEIVVKNERYVVDFIYDRSLNNCSNRLPKLLTTLFQSYDGCSNPAVICPYKWPWWCCSIPTPLSSSIRTLLWPGLYSFKLQSIWICVSQHRFTNIKTVIVFQS